MNNIRYFELCFPSGWSMVIKALREPTVEEATQFVSEDIKNLHETEIVDIVEWTREDALTAFDFDDEENWPVFGMEG